jgi:diaminohydroxyphosphoribosylaminopyrimidine deaminase/5-amino-6-(5-phosphoribosylamino)uracil reductase
MTAQFSSQDAFYMAEALKLAAQGLYTTSPNPRVGCVIVKDNNIIGRGAHLKAGEPHAEVYALREAGQSAIGADAYVTLEPCSHTGRTPPCMKALIDAQVSRVIIAMQDPNPMVSGRGIAYLSEQGLQVEVGLMQKEAEALNMGFIKRMRMQMPYVRSKIAASLDGKTALSNGKSQWITSPASRSDVQHWRAQSCAILTGIGTVQADNPNMTVRLENASRQPFRVIVDSRLQIADDAKILQKNAENERVIVAYAEKSSSHDAKKTILKRKGVELWCLPLVNLEKPQVDLTALLQALAREGVNEVFVEAGQTLNGALLAQYLIDELILYYAPKLMGHEGQGMFAMPPLTEMAQAISLQLLDVRQVGVDIRLRAKPIIPS